MHAKSALCSFVLLAISHSALSAATDSGGVVLSATRVVYDASNKETSVSIKNKNIDQYFLVQSWIDDNTGNKKVPFAITPPLFRLGADKLNMLRIVKTSGNLPDDKESVFYINVKAIPPVPDDSVTQNTLQVAIKTRIKLFYRPKGLQGKPEDAYQQLQWSIQGNDLVVKNPSQYSVSFNEITVGGKDVKEINMVEAKSEAHYPLSAGQRGQISFSAINDFGGVSKTVTAH
ncbi:fimbrial biogenesis chaperone [Hafnia alvei]|uniref:P pilus assembly protein, chaperone PapD n=1 Tax=Hafnia alvei TaxID=569 RepID=A0A1C6YW22_HAFAL|nr:fimbria/pilus periplasmic chaperone [Hafnia alvei]NLS56144.1 fimbria/pilus periplasmic chaperone [Hafnia alvei]SCM51078.1 P pilus assembly protein, chaperone PapD [Hafnia alvei]